jgi:predicted alpha/beta-hydrolase family hydrolase
MPDFLITGPAGAKATLLLAHGAGAAMDSAWMNDLSARLDGKGVRVARFEFAYMAGRRQGERKPPPKGESLKGEYRDAVAALKAKGPLAIGGKSMGGRVASMVAEELFEAQAVAGLVCLGYPFHPPSQLQTLRTAHLPDLKLPVLICQGTRDPFGTREEVPGYSLSATTHIHWFEDGDHDLKPRKAVSGRTMAQAMDEAGAAVAQFVTAL